VNVSLLAAYGNWLKLRFERFEVSTISKEHVVSREFSQLKSKKSKKSSKSQTMEEEHTEVPNDVKHLTPGTETLHHVPGSSKSKKQGRKEKVEEGDLPMEERLTNLTIDAPVRNELPQGENLGHLLSQGLHSKDTRILQSVLHRSDEKLILNTVRSLPVQLVLPLVEEIKVMLTGKSQVNHCVLRWLKAVFQIHSSYLMCCSSNEELMGPIMSLLRARETLYPQMCLLKGKLELVKGHVAAKQYKADVPNEALLTYQDESSDEDDKQEDGLLPSESEEFLTSDDLDRDNSGSEEEGKEKDSDSSDDNSEDDEEDENEPKLNGKGEGSDESMDED
jgi:U3 small nucleolar RNA-associated protein 5